MPSTENLLQGVGYLWYAALTEDDPADIDIADAPATGWSNLGFTNDGVTMTVSQEYSELEVDQIADIPGRRLIKREIVVATNLAEATLENLERALNGATTSDGVGFKNLEPNMTDIMGEPDYFKIILDGFSPGGNARRLLVRKALQVGEIESAQNKEDQTVFPVEFHGHYVSTSVAPYKVTDQVP